MEEEAERVRLIFRRYLELASLGKLMEELRERGIVTKMRHLSNGRTIRRDPLHTRLSRLSFAQPLLHWRSQIPG